MAGKIKSGNPMPVSDLASAILDPLLRKRAGISIELLQSWDEIAGTRLSRMTRPEKIVWPRRMHEEDPFQPATLIVACEGAVAIHVQHETGEIIGRVNAFLGFNAVGRIKIVQKPVSAAREKPRPRLRPVSSTDQARIDKAIGGVEDEALRASLEKLGRSVFGSSRRDKA